VNQIKQSFSWWCFDKTGIPPRQLLHAAADIGYQAVELVEPEHWPLIRQYGLTIASINGGLSIAQGLNRREHHDYLEQRIRATIEQAAQWDIPNVIVFSGNREGLHDRMGAEITAEGLRRVAGAAEEAGVTLVMELLNSKVDHKDYQCDRTAWGVEVCQMVNSPRVKLLYDIYHMQIMEGDIIRTIRDFHAYFAHYHTAGNPGRHELDDTQELNYPPIIRAILATGYQGYLGQEFIPRGDPLAALKQAFDVCNVSRLTTSGPYDRANPRG
jgi:hydroxypyruvate isomerase